MILNLDFIRKSIEKSFNEHKWKTEEYDAVLLEDDLSDFIETFLGLLSETKRKTVLDLRTTLEKQKETPLEEFLRITRKEDSEKIPTMLLTSKQKEDFEAMMLKPKKELIEIIIKEQIDFFKKSK